MANPHIVIDLFTRLHGRQARQTERQTVKHFEELGRKSAQQFSKEIENAAPRVRRAVTKATDSVSAYTAKQRAANAVREKANKLTEHAEILEGRYADQYDRTALTAKEVEKQEKKVTAARKAHASVLRGVTKREANLQNKRDDHISTAAALREAERHLNRLRVENGRNSKEAIEFEKSILDLRDQNAAEISYIQRKEFELGEARDNLAAKNKALKDAEDELKLVRKEHENGIKDLNNTEKELIDTREESIKTDKAVVEAQKAVKKAYKEREEAIRAANEAAEEAQRKEEKRNAHGRRKQGGLGVVGNMLTDLPFVPSGRAGAFIGGGMLLTLASVAEAAVTASQALTLLPAAGAAGAAAFGSLALGVVGFSDAVKEMGDPEKFVEALEGLSPAAQQAALEIQYLAQGPLKELKDATQETLFSGVAERLRGAANTFLPVTSQLTQGVSGSMNNMFGNFIDRLSQPDAMASIGNVVENIVTAFQRLEPAVAPFTEALLRITEVGSDFLPQIADGLTNAANSFADFIREAQHSGAFHEFIQRGIEATKQIIKLLGDLGKWIYDTFGNKTPEEFAGTIEAVEEAAKGLIEAIVGAANVVNDLLAGINPIVEAMGGWENVIKAALTAFLAWKTAGLVSMIGELATGIASIGTGLGAIPGAAGSAGGALSRLANLAKGGPWALLATALGVSAYAGYTGYQHYADVEERRSTPRPPLTSVFSPTGPIGPGLPQPTVNLPADPNATGGIGPSNPLLAGPQAAQGAPRSGAVDYKQWYGDNPATAGLPDFAPHDMPVVPPEEMSDSARREAIDAARASLNPADFAPPGFTGLPGAGMPMPPIGAPTSLRDTGSVTSGPQSQMAAALIEQQFGHLLRGPIGGSRDNNTAPGTHDAGLSIDIPIGPDQMAVGDAINQFLQQNAGQLGLEYTIWRNQGQYPGGAPGAFQSEGHMDHIDAHFNGQGGNGMPPIGYGTGGEPYAQPGYGYYNVDQQAVWKAQNRRQSEAFDVQQAAMDLAALEKSGVATDQEILEAKWKLWEQENQFREAEMDLAEEMQGDWKKIQDQQKNLIESDPWLDPDLGLSRGLPGFVENLFKGFAHALAEPFMGQLRMITGGKGIEDTGMGLFGMSGANNMSRGLSPILGRPMPQMVTPYGMDPSMLGGPSGPGYASFGDPGSPQAIANMIYQQAVGRGYSDQEARSIVAYAIGESGLNPGISGGPQGGAGAENEVVGLFQQKPDFARSNGIDPSMRTDPVANTYAYLNALDKTRAANPGMGIEQLLPKTSVGGPLASGSGAQPQAWQPLMNQANSLLGGSSYPAFGGGGSPLPGVGMPQSMPMPATPYGLGQQSTTPLQPTGATTGAAAGAGAGSGAGFQYNTSQPASANGWQPAGGGFAGLGGLPMGAIQAGISAAGMAGDAAGGFGGGSAAAAGAQMLMQLANRAIGYGGQVAAIGASGLLETFGLSDSALGDPNKSWLGRMFTGFAGAKPATPGSAGQTQTPLAPEGNPNQHGPEHQGQPQNPMAGGVHIQNFNVKEQRSGQGMANDLAFQSYAAGSNSK